MVTVHIVLVVRSHKFSAVAMEHTTRLHSRESGAFVENRTQSQLDGHCEDCRRSPQEPSSPVLRGRVAREQRKDQWRACGRGIGRQSSVQQLGNTLC